MLGLARDPRIVVTGFVADLGAYIKQAKLVIVPLRCGAGISMKILQALAFGRPVVATSHGVRGVDVQHGRHLMIADDPEEFAQHVNVLLNDETTRARLGKEGSALVRSRYSFDAVYCDLGDLVARVAQQATAISARV
jgi:glycosyltransferase involved in cell wall biosynthesis